MKKKRIYAQARELEDYYSKFPEWYWKFGLHDAKILSADSREGDLVISLDGEGALYESDIYEITLTEYKIIDSAFDISKFNLSQMKDGWWLGDTIEKKGDRYMLDLDFCTKKCKNKNVKIKFKEAIVKRR